MAVGETERPPPTAVANHLVISRASCFVAKVVSSTFPTRLQFDQSRGHPAPAPPRVFAPHSPPHTSAAAHIMVWPFGSSEPEGVKKTSGGAFESPSRTNRAKCYEARDAFFECLDRNNILDSVNTKDGQAAAKKACGAEDMVFEKNCAHSWVDYFKKQRVVNYQKEQTIKKIEAEGGDIQAPQLPTRGGR